MFLIKISSTPISPDISTKRQISQLILLQCIWLHFTKIHTGASYTKKTTKQFAVLTSPKCHKQGQQNLKQLIFSSYVVGFLHHSYNWTIINNLTKLLSCNNSWVNYSISNITVYKYSARVFSILLTFYIFLFLLNCLLLIQFFLVFWFVIIGMFLQIMIFTAHERKMLALIQRRTGPAVIGVRGRLQCLADSLKLLLKTFISARNINTSMFQFAAMGGFWISWLNFSNLSYGPGLRIIDIEYNLFFLLFVSIIFSIIWLITGWSSVSKYAILGCYRAIIQIIAFELLIGTVILIVYAFLNCFNFELITSKQSSISLFLLHPPLAIITLFIFFMETNRPPFDLSEAESDLVAGYNVEYGGFLFGLFYLSEYINLFTACTILVILFNGAWNSYFTLLFQWILQIICLFNLGLN